MADTNEVVSLPLQVLKRHKRFSLSSAQGNLNFRASRQRSETLLKSHSGDERDLSVALSEPAFKISAASFQPGSSTPSSSRSPFGGDSSSDPGTDTERKDDPHMGADNIARFVVVSVTGIAPVDQLYGTDMSCVMKIHGGQEIGRTSTLVSAHQPAWPDESFVLPTTPLPNVPTAPWLTVEIWHAVHVESQRRLLAVAECTWREVQEAAQSGNVSHAKLTVAAASTHNVTESTIAYRIVMAPNRDNDQVFDLQPARSEEHTSELQSLIR